MGRGQAFATEAELVAAFVTWVGEQRGDWRVYPETADWDVLLVGPDGTQIGVEAKLTLNLKVLEQALPESWSRCDGPDFRAVLVPRIGRQHHLAGLFRQIGVTIISDAGSGFFHPSLPDLGVAWSGDNWQSWIPAIRCEVPEYVPVVAAGVPSPVKLSEWKVKAIKLLILLERRGHVTRSDMRHLGLSPTRWTAFSYGFLDRCPRLGGYVRSDRTPDLRSQMPENYGEIEADFERWAPPSWAGGADLLSEVEGV